MARTRSGAGRPSKDDANGTKDRSASPGLQELELAKPTKTFILPKGLSPEARFVLLENPRTGSSSRYLYCPACGIYEFTAISAPSSDPRSILFTSQAEESELGDETKQGETNGDNPSTGRGRARLHPKAAISKSAEICVATPVDLLFFILPVLLPQARQSDRRLFQPLDDMLDAHDNMSRELKNVLLGPLRPRIEERMKVVCDTVEAGETMFRVNEEKMLEELLSKAKKTAEGGLPPSMEDKFVTRALEMPVMSVKREDVVKEETATKDATSESKENGQDSKEPAADAAPPLQETKDNEMRNLLRIRVALSFILSSYVPKHITAKTEELLASSKTVDFAPLEKHLKHIADLRSQAIASRSIGDFSRKRSGLAGEEAFDAREEKRLKQEEEKKSKARQSRGVRDLKKADTSGMKKLSSFFGKPQPKK
ncbi:hypothetical protein KEM55_002968 [Ascosphaera atra]|nr:hypothetical protein KEM55_002968 [Ascosphaera atra]